MIILITLIKQIIFINNFNFSRKFLICFKKILNLSKKTKLHQFFKNRNQIQT